MSETIVAALIGGAFAVTSTILAAWFSHILGVRHRQKNTVSANMGHSQEPVGTEKSASRLTPVTLSGSPKEDQVHIVSSADGGALQIPRILCGFILSILAALFWGVGNAVTRWTVASIPETAFDVAILKYLVAGVVLVVCGLCVRTQHEQTKSISNGSIYSINFFMAAICKSINTYSWVVAVTIMPATIVATLENLHVVWISLILIVFLKVRVPGTWLTSSVIVLIGASLITGIGTESREGHLRWGLILGLNAGLFFALFNIFWVRGSLDDLPLWRRTTNMGAFLILSGLLICPFHAIYVFLFEPEAFVPFRSLPFEHLVVQSINGLVGIGLTYFLINEAVNLMKNSGHLASVLLGLGISFAVLFTLLTEAIWFSETVTRAQWLGVLLFSTGFAAVRSHLLRQKEKLTTSPQAVSA